MTRKRGAAPGSSWPGRVARPRPPRAGAPGGRAGEFLARARGSRAPLACERSVERGRRMTLWQFGGGGGTVGETPPLSWLASLTPTVDGPPLRGRPLFRPCGLFARPWRRTQARGVSEIDQVGYPGLSVRACEVISQELPKKSPVEKWPTLTQLEC